MAVTSKDDPILRRARETVDRLSHAQVRRLAEMDPHHIVLALSREAEEALDRRALERLRDEIARLCRARAGEHAA